MASAATVLHLTDDRAVSRVHQEVRRPVGARGPDEVPGTPGATTAANEVYYGQYHAPIGEYILPENVPERPSPRTTSTPSRSLPTAATRATPAIQPITDQNVTAGNPVTLSATTTSVPTPAWAWTQAAGPAVAGTYTFSVKATNANGTSPATTVNVVVATAVPTSITLNNVYRTAKQCLLITATSTDTAVATMKLMPYLTEAGTTFDPATLGVVIGTSPATALTTIRQWEVTRPRPGRRRL